MVIYLLMQAIASCKESVNIILYFCWEAYCLVNDSAMGYQTFEFTTRLQSKVKTIGYNLFYPHRFVCGHWPQFDRANHLQGLGKSFE